MNEPVRKRISRRKFLQESSLQGAGFAALGGGASEPLLASSVALSAASSGLMIAQAASSTPSTSIYVSPSGNDSNDGSRQEPLATIQRARDTVRHIKHGVTGPIEVVLLPGTYYVRETLAFGPEDSGTAQSPILYRASEDGAATVSGGMRLQCDWAPYERGIWQCAVPEANEGKLNFSELYVNGRRQIRARYPNGDSRIPQPAGYARAAGADKWPHKELYFDPQTFSQKRWAHPEDAVLFAFQRVRFNRVPFFSGQWRVRGLDRARNAILLGEGGNQQLLFHYLHVFGPGLYADLPYYVENLFEELDAPGEWFLDHRAGRLYYIPEEGVDLKTAVVEPALNQRVIRFQGTPQNPIKHLALSGLRIAHAASSYFEPYVPAGLGDYTVWRGGALAIEGAEDITVERCAFDGVSGNGIFVNEYARRVRLTNNRLADIGENGICFIGKQILREDKRFHDRCGFLNWWGWDPETTDIPMDCEASNNLVHDTGVFAKQSAGIMIATSQRITLAHNEVYNVPRSGINLNDARYGGHRIEFNDVHDTVRETADHGPLNSYGREPFYCHYVCHPMFMPENWPAQHGDRNHSFGSREDVKRYARETTVIRHNRFSSSRRGGNPRPGNQFGIDLDDGSANIEVARNLCVEMGVKVKEGTFLDVHDNFIVNSEVKIINLANSENHVRAENNTIFSTGGPNQKNAASPNEEGDRVRQKYMGDVHFGPTDDFPAQYRD